MIYNVILCKCKIDIIVLKYDKHLYCFIIFIMDLSQLGYCKDQVPIFTELYIYVCKLMIIKCN